MDPDVWGDVDDVVGWVAGFEWGAGVGPADQDVLDYWDEEVDWWAEANYSTYAAGGVVYTDFEGTGAAYADATVGYVIDIDSEGELMFDSAGDYELVDTSTATYALDGYYFLYWPVSAVWDL
jgi:hypothetical protein